MTKLRRYVRLPLQFLVAWCSLISASHAQPASPCSPLQTTENSFSYTEYRNREKVFEQYCNESGSLKQNSSESSVSIPIPTLGLLGINATSSSQRLQSSYFCRDFKESSSSDLLKISASTRINLEAARIYLQCVSAISGHEISIADDQQGGVTIRVSAGTNNPYEFHRFEISGRGRNSVSCTAAGIGIQPSDPAHLQPQRITDNFSIGCKITDPILDGASSRFESYTIIMQSGTGPAVNYPVAADDLLDYQSARNTKMKIIALEQEVARLNRSVATEQRNAKVAIRSAIDGVYNERSFYIAESGPSKVEDIPHSLSPNNVNQAATTLCREKHSKNHSATEPVRRGKYGNNIYWAFACREIVEAK
jgi:hypothetical protein